MTPGTFKYLTIKGKHTQKMILKWPLCFKMSVSPCRENYKIDHSCLPEHVVRKEALASCLGQI